MPPILAPVSLVISIVTFIVTFGFSMLSKKIAFPIVI